VGILDLERKKLEKNSILKNHTIIGYFISLSGFKETALEQERELDGDRVNLIKPDKIIEELIKGKVIVGIEKAIASLRGIFGDLSLLDYTQAKLVFVHVRRTTCIFKPIKVFNSSLKEFIF
jgi:hypothetical protein